MQRIGRVAAAVGTAAVAVVLGAGSRPEAEQARSVRVAVIGGMTMTEMWQEISRMYEQETGERVELVVTGVRSDLAEAMQAGRVDLLTMHSGGRQRCRP